MALELYAYRVYQQVPTLRSMVTLYVSSYYKRKTKKVIILQMYQLFS